jgi:beta-galactosidase
MGTYGQPEQLKAFGKWLEEQYGSPIEIETAWNLYPGDTLVRSMDEATSISIEPNRHLGYGVNRDRVRFVSDVTSGRIQFLYDLCRQIDPDHYYFIGSHQLLYNQASLGWDHDKWAKIGDLHFSSLHLSWHFEPVWGELDRPEYMMARLTHDYKKGGWTSCYETTGGAVQYSGGYGNSMSPELIRRLMLYFLASGNKSTAFWTWNHRPGGWEAGEYGMTSYSGKITSWAVEAGRVARVMQQYKKELWTADHEVKVGILINWDNEALYLSEPKRYELQDGLSDFVKGAKVQPVRALIGASRAMINHQIAYEYVTLADLEAGIGARYPAIYAPHMRGISKEGIEVLKNYVENGGRLIADVQFAFSDQWGKMHPKGKNSQMAGLFGAWIDMIHDNRTANRRIGEDRIDGFYGDIELAGAEVVKTFEDGRPALTRFGLGRGESILIGYDAGMMCFKPRAATGVEVQLASLVSEPSLTTWKSNVPLAFQLRTKIADHYFLFNDTNEKVPVALSCSDKAYTQVEDVIEGETWDYPDFDGLSLEPGGSIWLRCK